MWEKQWNDEFKINQSRDKKTFAQEKKKQDEDANERVKLLNRSISIQF